VSATFHLVGFSWDWFTGIIVSLLQFLSMFAALVNFQADANEEKLHLSK